MNKNYEPLFTPWKIGNVEIKNRIVLCPMGGTSLFGWMEPHHFDKDSADFFMDLAKNNVGLVIPGIAPLRNLIGGQWLYKAKGAFKKLKKYMEEFHKTGAKLFVQLTAGFGRSFSIPNALVPMLRNKFLGALLKPIFNISYLTASPSELPSRWAENAMCREMKLKEIEDIIYAYARTSKMLKEAGVDGVEVHAVHEGYLLDQFTTKYTNHRQDNYGGSFENRYRFPVEIVKAIKAECGDDYPVSVRYSVVSKTKGFCQGALPGEKYKEVGRDMAESEKAAKYLQDAGYDMLNADNGTYDAWYWAHPPVYMPQNCNLEDCSHIKKFVDIPVVCAGKMTPLVASNAIKNKEIDAMGVARQFLVDSHWVTKLKAGKEEDIMPCICCHNACFVMSHYKGVANAGHLGDTAHMARCALNPQTMDGGKYDYKPAKKKKNIAVIGGGIGGMETARILTLRGHNVTIYEKSDKLGGIFISAAAPDFKEKDKELIEWFRRQIKALKIKVKFNTEITDLKQVQADEIVVATGSKAKKIGLPGIERAIETVDYLNGKTVGDNVVVIGGGLSGCEVAYDLHLKGKKPVIIEAKNDLMAVSNLSLANTSYLRDYFATNKVPVYLESKCKEITDKAVIILDKDGNEKKIKADDVILAIGYNPNPIAKQSKKVHIVGDALEVGNLRTVIWRAWDIATKL
ncbi:MAG: FAD-dependent oxidoreductase [Clostridia bacterium]|nr:FAD-dependent oxidoreductase [Clostridia bacterium]